MTVLAFDFYAEDDPNGTLLGTLDDQDCDAMGFRPALHELGSGSFTINRHHPLATSALIRENNLVKVRMPSVHADPIFAFWLKEGDFELIDKEGEHAETLTFSGPGVLFVLGLARLWHSSATPDQPARGSLDVPDMWTWINEPPGAITVRGIEEGQNELGAPLADVTVDFDRVADSGGVVWPIPIQMFQTPIGTDILSLADRQAAAGDFYLIGHPNLLVQAFQTYGRDLAGAFGPATVRLERGVNIETKLGRKIAARDMLTHLLQRDANSDYSTEVWPDFVAGQRAHWGFSNASQTSDDSLLNKMGQNSIAASRTSGEQLRLEITPGFDPANGFYMIGPPGTNGHIWYGDTIRLHTGVGEHEFNEADQVVVAMEVALTPAVKDDTTDKAAKSLHVWVELNYQEVRGFSTLPSALGQPGYPDLRLCDPGINLLLRLENASLKASADGPAGFDKAKACDGDESTAWSDPNNNGVPGGYWAADLGSEKSAVGWRLATLTASAEAATAAKVYGSNDPAAWTWLPVGLISADPTAHGWTELGGYSGLSFPVDTGERVFAAPQSFRYWLFEATAGPPPAMNNDWDISEVELWTAFNGIDPCAARPDRTITIEELRTGSTDTSQRLAPDGQGGVEFVPGAGGTADEVAVADAGGYFTGTDQEAIDQEIGAELADHEARLDDLEAGTATDALEARRTMHGRFVSTFHRDSDKFPMVMYSDDGITWRDGAIIEANVCRDPSMIHWDGRWWVVLTRYAVTSFGLFVSDDLENWTEIAGGSGITVDAGAANTWAPEWVRNADGTPYLHPSTGFPVVTVSAKVGGVFTIRELHPTNRGMTAWSGPTTITGTGFPTNMIDGFLIVVDGVFNLWYKDQDSTHIEYASGAALTSGYARQEDGNWAGWGGSMEGPTLVRLDDGRWRIYMNENSGLNSVEVWYSESLDNWATWSTKAAIVTDALMAHGTVIYIPGMSDHQRDPAAHADVLADYATLADLADVTVSADDIRDAGHWEVMMVDGVTPPEPMTTEDETDWLYAWIPD